DCRLQNLNAATELNLKSQIPSTKSQGVGCQVSGVREEKQKTETCWSEAAAGNTETSVCPEH
ncbi:MAG: hypothetical protein V3R70_01760, partial [Syntrophobacteria bacterium]